MKKQRNILLALRWYHPKIHLGVARYAREAGWHLNAELSRMQQVSRDWDGDGILTQEHGELSDTLSAPLNQLLAKLNQPRVLFGTHVRNNDQAIGQLAAEHFRQQGFRHVATLDPFMGRFRQPRFVAFAEKARQFARVHSIEIDGKAHWPQRRKAIIFALKRLPKPIGVFALDDDGGAWIIESCMHAELRIPDQIAVLGVRNDELICEALSVPLSSIENNLERVGYEGAALLDRLLEGKPLPKKPIQISPQKVVIRQSSDTLAITHSDVRQAMLFIRANFRQMISIDDVVEQTTLSQRGLYKAFERELGRSIVEQIRLERLHFAQDLLLQSQHTVEKIAHLSGMTDGRQLHRLFRQATGLTPRQWKARHTGQTEMKSE